MALLNSLMVEIKKEGNPALLSDLLYSPKTSSMSNLLQVSPDLHHRRPAFLSGAEVKRVLEPAFESVYHNVRVSECFLFPELLLVLLLSPERVSCPGFTSLSRSSLCRPLGKTSHATHHAQTVPLLCAGTTDSLCTLSGGAAVLAPPPSFNSSHSFVLC